MEKTVTSFSGEVSKVSKTALRPKQATVEFLKQFARAYSYHRLMPAGLGNFVAN